MRGLFRPALLLLLILTVITGVLYPLILTGLAGTAFPGRSRGSLVSAGGRLVGSALIGQQTDGPRYFWGRPSATSPPCNAAASSGSNLGPMNPTLEAAIRGRVNALRDADRMAGVENRQAVPIDLVTTSGSGLDPHISPAAALFQVPRVARLRGMDEARMRQLVRRHIEGRQFGFLGEPRVNVLRLNVALDGLADAH